jgi:glycosyltransferase involved in cell wall biosynthesis
MSESRLRVIASTVDHGTSSITSAYLALLKPHAHLLLPDGVKRGGLRPLLHASKVLQSWQRQDARILCLFNMPTLLGAYVPRIKRKTKRVAILDWTANCPKCVGKPYKRLYDIVYRIAFSRLDAVASPSKEFREFYSNEKTKISPILYPLPYPEHQPKPRLLEGNIKVLFIGADLERKGGHQLLHAWESHQPQEMELTFVTPAPPDRRIEGVTFRNDINAGTDGHRKLFETHDLLILPSYSEPFGYVLLEAINFGLVPLTPRSTGAAEIVENAGGFLLDTPESCIENLFSLQTQRQEIEARKHKVCQYNPAHTATCIEQIRQLFN